MRHRGASPLAGLGRVSPSLGRRAPVLVPGRGWGVTWGEERKEPAPTWMAACAGLVLLALMLLAAAETIGTTSTSAAPPASRIKYTK